MRERDPREQPESSRVSSAAWARQEEGMGIETSWRGRRMLIDRGDHLLEGEAQSVQHRQSCWPQGPTLIEYGLLAVDWPAERLVTLIDPCATF